MMTVSGDPGIVTMNVEPTDETHEAGTATGENHVSGNLIVAGIETNDDAGTVITFVEGIVAITTSGTYVGTFSPYIITVNGDPGIVMTNVEATEVTHEAGNATGDVHVEGTLTTVGGETHD
jgi:hypothetical protein